MKKSAVFISLLLLFAALWSCKSNDADNQAPVETAAPDEPVEEILGGFKKIPVDSRAARDAFAFLKTEIARQFPAVTLLKLTEAQEQVVAGMNYRLVGSATDEQGELAAFYALVFRGLDNTWKLTEWSLTGGG